MLKRFLIIIVLMYAFNGLCADKKFIIGFPQDNMSNDWRKAQVMEFKSEIEKNKNVKFVYSDARGSTAKQILDIEEMIDSGVDLIVVSPKDRVALTPVISKAYKKGIHIVLLTRSILSDEYDTYISPDDKKIARSAAVYLAEKMNYKGKVLVLQGVPTASTAIARTEGFVKKLAEYKKMSIVGILPANYLRSEALRKTDMAIESGKVFDAVYAQSDSMASGARIALKHAGFKKGDIKIIGIDYISEARRAIRAGEQIASFTYPTCGKEGAVAAMKILLGEKVSRHIEVDSTIVTPENVDTVKPIF